MNKIFAVVVMLVLLAVLFAGCNDEDSSSSTSYLSVFEVCEHPNKYLDQEITIKGYYYEDSFATISFRAAVEDMSQHVYGYAIELIGYITMDKYTLVEGGIYLFEGRLAQNSRAVIEEYMPLHLMVHNITAV